MSCYRHHIPTWLVVSNICCATIQEGLLAQMTNIFVWDSLKLPTTKKKHETSTEFSLYPMLIFPISSWLFPLPRRIPMRFRPCSSPCHPKGRRRAVKNGGLSLAKYGKHMKKHEKTIHFFVCYNGTRVRI